MQAVADDKNAQAMTSPESRISAWLDEVSKTIIGQRRWPQSTYRLQFHAGFKFRDACKIIPYLHDLGITDCYASPYLKARSGSKHGYDISDHQALNPEIGSEVDYDTFAAALQAHGMGQILDIVPNHMGIIGNENAWWNDVLENGPCARHAGYFDIDWYPIKAELREKVLLGILGEPYGKVLEAGHITLNYESGAFVVNYFEHRFPVAPESALLCLRLRLDELEQLFCKDNSELMEYHSILTALAHLPPRSEINPLKVEERYREKEVIKRRLAALTDSSPAVRGFIQQNVTLFNGNQGDPSSFNLLDQILNDQAYRLAFWQVAADEINYRRFFDVNELAALSMEKPEVFAETHRLILRLLGERKVTGLRIDHPDGLYDPCQYFDRLQQNYILELVRLAAQQKLAGNELQAEDLVISFPNSVWEREIRNHQASKDSPLRAPLYIVAEKILGKEERLPEGWPIHGTTGYEFLNMVNGLFVDSRNELAFSRIYHRSTGMDAAFRPYVYDKKFLILQVALSSELHLLAHQLDRLSEKNRWSRDFTLNSLRHALREIIACFPVYRSYITEEVVPRDRQYVDMAVRQAKRKNPAISSSLFDFVRDMLLLRYPDSANQNDRAEQRRFVGKFQQVTAPVMAKGLEDTSFYVYNRLVSLNEVGGDPGRFGLQPAELHAFLKERAEHWHRSLSTSSTHDTKRSEDVRARLNVLAEIPRDWQKALGRWKLWNKRHRTRGEGPARGEDAPDRNDEYLLYQTLIGAWPLEGVSGGVVRGEWSDPLPTTHHSPLTIHSAPPLTNHYSLCADFVERICQYMEKAAREAKVHSSWINPDPAYDDAVRRFVTRILDEKISGRFLADFRAFCVRISHVGMFNSLAQTLVKLAAPGVPDFYQGTELWDFSLVDPDNRRPVDYDKRRRMLGELQTRLAAAGEHLPTFARELVTTKEDGRIKLYLIFRGLQCRRLDVDLFAQGEYAPVSALGSRAENVFAFVRRLQDRWVVAVVPRLLARLMPNQGDLPLGPEVWQDSFLILPGIQPHQRLRNVLTGEPHDPTERDGQVVLSLAEVFANFPVALFVSGEQSMAHLTSLNVDA
jgi:(1->4)-alpha-D-glucan 1-alpha-D-glucosylmutase